MIYEILLSNGSLIKRWILINQNPSQLVIAEKPKNYDFHETYHKNGIYHLVVRVNKKIVRKELKKLSPINNFSGIMKLERHILQPNPFLPNSSLILFTGNKTGFNYHTFNYDGSRNLILDIYLIEYGRNDFINAVISRFKSINSKYYQEHIVIDGQAPWIMTIFSLVDRFRNENEIKTISGTEILNNPNILKNLNL